MLLAVPAGHQNVVNEHEDEPQAVEDVVHETLEGHSSVFEAEGHLEELKKSKWRNDECLGNC